MSTLALQMIGAVGVNAMGALFIGTALSKALDQSGFASLIAAYRLFPLGMAFPVARVLTGVQLVLGAWLCSGMFPREACLTAAILLTAFALAMGINVARGRTGLSCGCLPGQDMPLSRGAVLRTIMLAVLMLGAAETGRPDGTLLSLATLMGGISLILLTLAFLQLRNAGDAA
ncbi:MauE/DoxX family redox-associated membrane protein [Asaia krungthepensis]|uniref:Methylamine utilization protein MauE n=1 Tax=Asaia krungthepensis NRIC 0535 TaxID=1307925 RepID=A0ABQ0PVG4_9PROT|nr:MauE/DoxX family redox-associated membrane protein [Asaia krungthepensis]GBQ82604.1 hypothetical protein AA0535_0029 [Asaia krungthepensis NRIC 0535]